MHTVRVSTARLEQVRLILLPARRRRPVHVVKIGRPLLLAAVGTPRPRPMPNPQVAPTLPRLEIRRTFTFYRTAARQMEVATADLEMVPRPPSDS